MILAIDIGNTNIVIGCIKNDNIIFTERLSTDKSQTVLEYIVEFKTVIELHEIKRTDIKGCIVSSVVPSINPQIKESIKKLLGRTPLFVEPGIKTGLNIRLDDPSTIGADLIVDSVAAIEEYGAPNIVIDMGTATTITVIDKDGIYKGGVLIPGVNTSLSALVMKASKLPAISLSAPKKVIGSNTIDAMNSGIVYGEACKIDGLIDLIKEELKEENISIVATGGLSSLIIPYCKNKIIIDGDLTLKGLNVLYKKNK